MRLLITGANGQLGRCLSDRMPEGWVILRCDSQQLDITNASQVNHLVATFKPEVIINAAAWTAVDQAENHPQQAMAINGSGPENLARAARDHAVRLIHVSTDYVFDGSQSTPWQESDRPAPLNVYGATKWQGEQRVQALLHDAIIVRTSWVFSEYGNNFVKTMLRLAQSRESLNVVSDQTGCPTYAGDLADCLISLAQHPSSTGIYHYCGDTSVSWCEFAEAIFADMKTCDPAAAIPKVSGINAADYASAVVRPAMSVLGCQRIEALGIVRSDWRTALKQVISLVHSSGC